MAFDKEINYALRQIERAAINRAVYSLSPATAVVIGVVAFCALVFLGR
jgi:hypothetical protein